MGVTVAVVLLDFFLPWRLIVAASSSSASLSRHRCGRRRAGPPSFFNRAPSPLPGEPLSQSGGRIRDLECWCEHSIRPCRSTSAYHRPALAVLATPQNGFSSQQEEIAHVTTTAVASHGRSCDPTAQESEDSWGLPGDVHEWLYGTKSTEHPGGFSLLLPPGLMAGRLLPGSARR